MQVDMQVDSVLGAVGVIELRRARPGDAQRLLTLGEDDQSGFAEWFGTTGVEFTAHHARQILDEISNPVGQYGLVRLVGPAGADDIIGLVTIAPPRARRTEVCYLVAGAHRGTGIGTRALQLAVDLILNGPGLQAVDRIEALVDATNVTSIRVAENAGFVNAGARTVMTAAQTGNQDWTPTVYVLSG